MSLWSVYDPVDSKPAITRSSSSVGSKKGRTYYSAIVDNKDIAKSLSYLSTSINSMKEMVNFALTPFHRFEKVWKVDRNAVMEEFLEKFPDVNDFHLEMVSYMRLESQASGKYHKYNCFSYTVFRATELTLNGCYYTNLVVYFPIITLSHRRVRNAELGAPRYLHREYKDCSSDRG